MRNILPTTWFLSALVIIPILHLLLPGARWLPFPWTLVGALPVLVGVGLNLSADAALKRYGTTVKPLEETTALITEGVFGISRNPMYLGMILILLGLAILLGTASPLPVVLVFALLLQTAYVRPEEQKLARTFPRAWPEYRSRVRRWG
jgi:protein-S-isoprenylcysteine O-methyltransferase Ste14